MSQAVIKATEQLVQRQAELWQQTISAAHDQWQRITRQSTEQMQHALGTSLSQSLAQHAAHLAKIEQASAEQLQRWEQWQTALSHNARLLHAQQQEMVKQGELMTQAIRAAGDVVQLERALNDNLSALAGAKNFEDTVMSLAAAIHLLNARLGNTTDSAAHRAEGPARERPRGMKRTVRRQTAERRAVPFLAVLICTMGVLIVLLVLFMQQARVEAQTIVAARVRPRRRWPTGQKQQPRSSKTPSGGASCSKQQRTEKAAELAESRARLAHLEEHIQKLERRARQSCWPGPAKSTKASSSTTTQLAAGAGRAGPPAGRDQPQADRAGPGPPQAARPRSSGTRSSPTTARNGTRRRPIYLECTDAGIVLAARGHCLSARGFQRPDGTGQSARCGPADDSRAPAANRRCKGRRALSAARRAAQRRRGLRRGPRRPSSPGTTSSATS